MRNANAQRVSIMVSASALQQPLRSHVSHAQSSCGTSKVLLGALAKRACTNNEPTRDGDSTQSIALQDGQRCALLTTKSRNTCTRATVFSSSG